jgi:hypothetical protein
MTFEASYPPRLFSVNVFCAVVGGKPIVDRSRRNSDAQPSLLSAGLGQRH